MGDGAPQERPIVDPERLLAAAVESCGDAIFSSDLDGCILTWNLGAEYLYGYTTEEIVGKSAELLEGPESRGEIAALLRRVRKGDRIARHESLRHHKDGRPLEISATISPVVDNAGRIYAAFTTERDIAERKRVERDLKLAEERLRLLTEHIDTAFWISEPGAQRIFYVSSGFEKVWHRSVESLYANPRSLRDDVHPDDRATFDTLLDRHARGEAYDGQYRIALKGGSVRWIRDRGFPVPDDAGHTRLMTGFATDITQLKTVEAELVRREREYATLAENAADMIVRFDREARLVYVNPAAERYLGHPQEEVAGKALQEIGMSPTDADGWQHSISSVLETCRPLSEPHQVSTPHGKRYFEANLNPEYRRPGEVDTVLAIVRDITPLKRNEEALQRRTEELARVNEELESFAYIASHDLKAPLRAVANLATWIEEDAAGRLDEENRERLHIMRERVARMGRLIDGLLDYARAGRTRTEEYEAVPLSTVLIELTGELPLPEGFRLETDEPLPVLRANPLHLKQIFQNLLDNAISHHDRPNEGSVHISAREEQGLQVIEVADDGPGIAPDARERVFRMFAKGPGGGTHAGVGLAVAKKLVESYRGRIEAEENRPRGTRFVIHWPK